MINFSTLQSLTIPEGVVTQIERDGLVIWNSASFYYVSLGDSIAVGHAINAEWESDYGYEAQYGENGNTETEIVPDSYTNLIQNELEGTYGKGKFSAKSFAHSGDTVADLMSKLSHETVRYAIKKANLVTVCIGANDVLQTAINGLESYINTGNPALDAMGKAVDANIAILNDDTNSNSYKALFDKLYSINPNATYVFTNVYNPLKYLWIDESTEANDYKDGFFGPLMWSIPETVGSLSNSIRGLLYDADAVQMVFDRINGPSRNGSDGLAAWTETYVSKLNNVLASKISSYGKSNFKLADTKSLYESVPDRPVSASLHYNDLVNVEFTRGYVIQDLDWGQFWSNVSWSDITSSYEAVMSNIMTNIVTNVFMPDIDPHPEKDGHYALEQSFADALGWNTLPRYTITYSANGASGSSVTQTVVGLNGLPAFTKINAPTFTPATGYNFTGWNTKADGSGTAYTNGQFVGLTGDMTLYAQWSNMCTVTFRHSKDSDMHDNSNTGPMECYALWIDGVEQSDLGAFSNGARTYTLPYGTSIGVIAQTAQGDARSYITWNGTTVAGKSSDARYGFTLTSNLDINFEWTYWLENVIYPQSYWNCYITTK